MKRKRRSREKVKPILNVYHVKTFYRCHYISDHIIFITYQGSVFLKTYTEKYQLV